MQSPTHTNINQLLQFDPTSKLEYTEYTATGTFDTLAHHIPSLVLEKLGGSASLINSTTGEIIFIGSYNNTMSFWRGLNS